MSSHREAPEISNDPVADNTDTYAFVSPDRPDTVTILANYIPIEAAAGGPNFYQFGEDVLYYIFISNNHTGFADIAFEFDFTTRIRNENTFLYNTGPISSIYDPHFNRRQTYRVRRIDGTEQRITKPHRKSHEFLRNRVIGTDLACPPVNIGPASTPNYANLANQAVHTIGGGIKVFAGQRNDGFFADLGAVFDLADLRPFQNLHAYGMMAKAGGVDTLKSGINVHTIAMQIPIRELTSNRSVPKNVFDSHATIGVWASAKRRKMQVRASVSPNGKVHKGGESGPWVQVSRLGNPLFNELLVPLGRKDDWNYSDPIDDRFFTKGVLHPELAALLPALYPGAFPNLAALVKSGKPRADLEAILLTGLPSGIVPGFQNNTGKHLGDMLRLNVAVPPTDPAKAQPIGLLAGDAAGFPNGRRVIDDIVTIELRALAGVTYALVDKSYQPDAAAKELTQGVVEPPSGAPGTARFLTSFPYLGLPDDGFHTPPAPTPGPGTPSSSSSPPSNGGGSGSPLPPPLARSGARR